MSNRTRDEGDYGDHGRGASSSYSSAGQRDWQERDRQERDRQNRQYGGRREQLHGRSDRDIQGDFSGGGYDQVGERDWSRSDVERDQRRTHGYGREGYSTMRSQSPDDDSRRGLSGSDLGYGSSGYGTGSGYGGYGSANAGYGAGPGGVGYGAPGYGAGSSYAESRYHGDFQSRGIGEDEGYGSYGRETGFGSESGGGLGQERHWHARRGEGYGNASSGQRTYGASGEYGRELGYGRSGQSSYGDYRSQSDLGNRRNYGMQGAGYGTQGTSTRNYRGVGPRNYTRSDERIREDLNERLTDAHDIDASMITVEVSNGVATLTGIVVERWMKHRAEDIADGCTGVRDVRNNIQVQSSGRGDAGSQRSDLGTSSGSGRYGSQGDRQDTYGSTSSQQGASGQYGSSQQAASGQYGSSQQGTSQAQGSSSNASSSGKSGGSSSSGMSGSSTSGSSAPGSSTSGSSSRNTGPNV